MPGDRVDLTHLLDAAGAWPGAPVLDKTAAPRSLSAGAGKALARLPIDPAASPLGGPGAVVILAHAAATAAAASALADRADLAEAGAGAWRPEWTPRPVQLTVNLFRDAARGILTAEAETIYRGRSTLVVDVKVRDERPGLVAALVFTQLAPRSPALPQAASARLAS